MLNMEDKKNGSNVKYVIIGLLFCLEMVGLCDHVWNIDANKCEMTYMWQNPEYIPVKVPVELSTKFLRYGIYSYGEGPLTALLSAGEYSGHPVLFVPGNGGSYKQVRSLASVAYRKSLEDEEEGEQKTPRFDFFTLDFDEDLAALYGPALEDQREYMVEAVAIIQKLYLTAKPVIIVGHSMGGMVARAAVMSPSLQGGVVPLIITLATPHAGPPLPLDPAIQHFYSKVDAYWALERIEGGSLANIALVSVGGGRNDVQVNPLAIVASTAHVTALTTSVPGCWATTDHQSIMWCKQLVLALSRALYDCVDRSTQLLHASTSRIAAIFQYHLVAKHSGNHYVSPRHRQQMSLSAGAKWTEVIKRQLQHRQPANSQHTYLMLPLKGQPRSKYHSIAVKLQGSDDKEWLFACTANAVENGVRQCKTGVNLSRSTRLLGEAEGKVAVVELRPLLEEGYTHVVVSLSRQDSKVVATWDTHGDKERVTQVSTPRLYQSFRPSPVLQQTPTKALIHELVLQGLNEPWHSYEVSVEALSGCPAKSVAPQLWITAHTTHGYALAAQWLDSGRWVYRVEQDEIALLPGNEGDTEPVRADVRVQLILPTDCTYSITVRASLIGAFRRILMLYGPQMPAFIVCHVLLALAMQLKSVGTSQYCPSLLSSILALTPMLVVPFVKLTAMVLKKADVYNDHQKMTDSGMDLGLLPIFFFFSLLPLTLLLTGGVWLTILAAGNFLNSWASKLVGAGLGTGQLATELALTGISKVPVIVAVALVAVAFSTCGALALIGAVLYYYMILFDMYKDHIRKVILKLIPRMQDETVPEPPAPAIAIPTPTDTSTTDEAAGSSDTPATDTPATDTPATDTPATDTPATDTPATDTPATDTPATDTPATDTPATDTTASDTTASDTTAAAEPTRPPAPIVQQSRESLSLQLHVSLLVLVILSCILQLPSLITWVRQMLQLGGGVVLQADPSLAPSVLTLVALAVLWQVNPQHDAPHYRLFGQLLHGFAVCALLFASISAYKLPYLIAAGLSLVAVQQVVAQVFPSHA